MQFQTKIAGEGNDDTHERTIFYLKTKLGKFKLHSFVIDGDGVIPIHRYRENSKGRKVLDQPLHPCHVRTSHSIECNELDDETTSSTKLLKLYPVQLDICSDRTRLFYFETRAA